MPLPSFQEAVIRKIADLLEGAATHQELTDIFKQCGLVEPPEAGPKWRRILLTLTARQQQDRCGNNVGAFVQAMMSPVRFVGKADGFESYRVRLNEILAFDSLQLREDGRLQPVKQARTLQEAQERAGRLRAELDRRRVHPDVLAFCRAELLEQNFFHAVFEATKSVAEKVRQRTGLAGDGAEIFQRAFGGSTPLLAINSLRTETEQSEQRGFTSLLVGTFGTFRNVTGHAPKIHWPVNEQDALDLLTLVSYLHRRIDAAVPTNWPPP